MAGFVWCANLPLPPFALSVIFQHKLLGSLSTVDQTSLHSFLWVLSVGTLFKCWSLWIVPTCVLISMVENQFSACECTLRILDIVFCNWISRWLVMCKVIRWSNLQWINQTQVRIPVFFGHCYYIRGWLSYTCTKVKLVRIEFRRWMIWWMSASVMLLNISLWLCGVWLDNCSVTTLQQLKHITCILSINNVSLVLMMLDSICI